MALNVLNQQFQVVHNLDDPIVSMIWSDRYTELGDFEIVTTPSIKNLLYLVEDNYLTYSGSDKLMIIERREFSRGRDGAKTMIVKGRSAESILDRRVIMNQTILSGDFQSEVHRLIYENLSGTSNPERMIPNFLYDAGYPSSAFSGITINAQYWGENLGEVIRELCIEGGFGQKVVLSGSVFVWMMYKGTDRSYAQEVNPHVVFSEKYDNLSSSNFFEDTTSLKNAALVFGEETEDYRVWLMMHNQDVEPTGLKRREIKVDASSITTKVDEGEPPITPEQYTQQLIQRGKEELANFKMEAGLDAEIDTRRTFKLNKDFFLGDVVQIVDDFGNDTAAQIVEVVYSHDPAGTRVIPRFSPIF